MAHARSHAGPPGRGAIRSGELADQREAGNKSGNSRRKTEDDHIERRAMRVHRARRAAPIERVGRKGSVAAEGCRSSETAARVCDDAPLKAR